MNNKKKYIGAISILAILGAILSFLLVNEKQTNKELVQEFELNKSELENEYSEFAKKYEEIKTNIFNDSLAVLLEKEQIKTQRLLEELRMVKSSNAAEIRRLKNELASLRQIMIGYISQIDSLNRLTIKQKKQIEEVTERYNKAAVEINTLSEKAETLNKKVALAAQLDATNIDMKPITRKGKVAKKIKDAEKLQITATISKNITTENGERTIFVRISKPDNEILIKNSNNTFKYENREIEYSIKRTIEYNGEEQNISLYWDIEEFLHPGTYRVELFEGGNLIGSRKIEINK